MITDIVFWGTGIGALLFLFTGLMYAWGIRKGVNGNMQDMYMALLFLALASNYGYLWFARIMMYMEYDRFMFLLVRTKYVPPVYLTIAVMIPLALRKWRSIRR